MWGQIRNGKQAGRGGPHTPHLPRLPPFPSGDVSETAAPVYVDGTRLPTVRFLVEALVGVYDALGESTIEANPVTGKMCRVPRLDPQVAQAQVRALVGALAGTQKDREMAFKEKLELAKARDDAAPPAPTMSLEDELSGTAAH